MGAALQNRRTGERGVPTKSWNVRPEAAAAHRVLTAELHHRITGLTATLQTGPPLFARPAALLSLQTLEPQNMEISTESGSQWEASGRPRRRRCRAKLTKDLMNLLTDTEVLNRSDRKRTL